MTAVDLTVVAVLLRLLLLLYCCNSCFSTFTFEAGLVRLAGEKHSNKKGLQHEHKTARQQKGKTAIHTNKNLVAADVAAVACHCCCCCWWCCLLILLPVLVAVVF